MSVDPNERREESLQGWEAAAPGWERRQELISRWASPVAHWLVDALAPQPGEQILELAAGLGETGMLAAELVAPVGKVIISDQAEAMLEAARRRAQALEVANLEFQVLNGEWIDLPLASVDGVLCRWGFMLMTDPATALGETRRVLRPGGRLATAVWDQLEHNPWARLPIEELAARGLAPAAGADGAPGPFALAAPGRLEELLEEAGFSVERLESLELLRRHESFEDFWEVQLDVSRSFHDAVLSLPEAEIGQVRASLERRLESFRDAAGGLVIPGRTLVALAEA